MDDIVLFFAIFWTFAFLIYGISFIGKCIIATTKVVKEDISAFSLWVSAFGASLFWMIFFMLIS